MRTKIGVASLFLYMITFVSAQNRIAEGLGKGMSQIISMIEGLLGPLFSVILGGTPDMLFEKVIFLVIIFCIVFIITKNMPVFQSNKTIYWIISVSIALLSTRFMSGDLLIAVVLPYSALGVALTSILPLFILFHFLMNTKMPPVGRKMAWSLYIVIFVTLWSTRYNQLQIVANIYIGGAILAFLFLLFDGRIKQMMLNRNAEKIKASQDALDRSRLQDKISSIARNTRLTDEEKENLIKPLKRTLKKYYKFGR